VAVGNWRLNNFVVHLDRIFVKRFAAEPYRERERLFCERRALALNYFSARKHRKDCEKMKIGILILAAGASRRLGEPKQLLKFAGETLLRRAARTALAANDCSPIVVVLGAHAEKLKPEIEDLPVRIVVCEDWAQGMSRSLRTGVAEAERLAPDLSAIVVTVCDQPFVTPATINRLIEIHRQTKKPIAACQYAETAGVPALFARPLFAELSNLDADAGAKTILKKHHADVAQTPAPEAAFDVDTEGDLQKLLYY
jgi:molybdenum cofactor cytidylyltransferase